MEYIYFQLVIQRSVSIEDERPLMSDAKKENFYPGLYSLLSYRTTGKISDRNSKGPVGAKEKERENIKEGGADVLLNTQIVNS